eukprot:Nk52_evm84s221 gene=Nk52_evmTU84s221
MKANQFCSQFMNHYTALCRDKPKVKKSVDVKASLTRCSNMQAVPPNRGVNNQATFNAVENSLISNIENAFKDVSDCCFEINLSGQTLELNEIKALCLTLERNSKLRVRLLLHGCSISDESMVYIVRLIRKDTGVFFLDLSLNPNAFRKFYILEAFVEALKFNTHLKGLILDDNSFKESHVSLICKFLSNPMYLERVSLLGVCGELSRECLECLLKVPELNGKIADFSIDTALLESNEVCSGG